MPSPRSLLRTLWTSIVSRTRVTSIGSGDPSRRILMVTLDPLGPRSLRTASIRVRSLVSWPSIFTIRSPGWMPARSAGVPSIGATTVSIRSFTVISMPSPPKLPWVSTCISLKASGGMKALWGSSVSSIPFTAP